MLVFLSLFGVLAGLPPGAVTVSPTDQTSSSNGPSDYPVGASPEPQSVGADPVSPISMPRTVVSSVDSLIGAGGVIQASADNLTLYNLAVRMRLLGGLSPRDELLGPNMEILSSSSFWSVDVYVGTLWIPLQVLSNNLTVFGTNTTGTMVERTMTVGFGIYTGTFSVIYSARPNGSLKWDLEFTPTITGHYMFDYSWSNITSTYDLSSPSRQMNVTFPTGNYTLSWNDVPSLFETSTSLQAGTFGLSIDLGTVTAAEVTIVDPFLVSTSSAPSATAFTFQRKVFYESKGGYYFVFYYDGVYSKYRSSRDGVIWSSPPQISPLAQQGTNPPAVFNSGQSVAMAVGTTCCDHSYFQYVVGNITGGTINWGSVQTPFTFYCACTFYDVENAGVTISATGRLVFSFNYYNISTAPSPLRCTSALYVWYGAPGSSLVRVDSTNGCLKTGASPDMMRSTLVPAGSQGRVRLIYQKSVFNGGVWSKTLRSTWFDATSNGTIEQLDSSVPDTPEFSAVSTPDYRVQVVWKTLSTNTVSYAYRGVSDASWTFYGNVFSGTAYHPTLTADYSTNSVYAFAVNSQNSSILMRKKASNGNWTDGSTTSPVGHQMNPVDLGSNFASASAANSSTLALVWTTGPVNNLYNVTFASIPIQTVWSPYADPSDPWNGDGIAPYAQYFNNLAESVSVSSGLLTIRQTDLSLTGRGLDLAFTRVYTEPIGFQNGTTYSYENYPWAPMGNGWQLNFPWMENVSEPQFIHLWNGESYRIPAGFWSGKMWSFENHQGEDFILSHVTPNQLSWTSLTTKSGMVYNFYHASHRLTSYCSAPFYSPACVTFQYQFNRIDRVIDTVGRFFFFSYYTSPILLQYITEMPLGNQATNWVTFGYSDTMLTSATDVLGRTTIYSYNATSDPTVKPWLISRLKYPTGWYSNYTFSRSFLGTEISAYRVTKQWVGTIAGTPVRQFIYSYSQGAGDQILGSTVGTYDGTQLVSNTKYVFSFGAVQWNVTDPYNSLVSGRAQQFGPHGAVTRETVLVADRAGGGEPPGSYTNFYSYDLWGNLIYSRQTINPLTRAYHESFHSYYNNGISPQFNSFQETFGQGQGNATDNSWNVRNGAWTVSNGQFNGTELSGEQADMIASADIGMANVSISANVYVGRQINVTAGSTPRVGIFAHYNQTAVKSYKWALVLVNAGTGGQLEVLDEWNPQWVPRQYPCQVGQGWYRFSMDLSGYHLHGTLSQTSGYPLCAVDGYFDATSPAAKATGFGLYAGGYSALFDNVTVTTAFNDGYRDGSFSNSFYPSGAPDPTVHGAEAGAAEHQNGTLTPPIETYYNDTLWGSPNQIKQRYDVSSSTTWITSASSYDIYGNPVKAVDPRGNSTFYSYSSRYSYAYLTNETHTLVPGNTRVVTLYAYNYSTGEVISRVDPRGYNTTYSYDSLARNRGITYPTGDYVAYSYNDAGNYVDITNENGWGTRQVYDGLGRLYNNQAFLNGRPYSNRTSTYNWQDRITSARDGMGNVTYYQYDAIGRLLNTTYPDRTSVLQYFNDTGSWILVGNQNKNYSCRIFDRLGRLISVVEVSDTHCHPILVGSNIYVTNYYYDEAGNLIRTVNAKSQVTVNSYDNLNRLITTVYSDNSTESYGYDANGNLASKVDRKNARSRYSYDSLNRLTSINYTGTQGAGMTYTYDQNGNTISEQAQNGTIYYSYDQRNRILSETYAVNPSSPDFSLSSQSTTIWAAQGSSGSTSITLQANPAFAGTISLSVSGLPSGATASFFPAAVSITPDAVASAALTIATSSNTVLGSYMITVTAIGGGGQSHSLTYTLTILVSSVSFRRSSIFTGVNGTFAINLTVNTAGSPQTVTGWIVRTALNSTNHVVIYNDTVNVRLTFGSNAITLFEAEIPTSPYWLALDCTLYLNQNNGGPSCSLNRTPDLFHYGAVNSIDASYVLGRYGCSQGQSCYDAVADLDADGVITSIDYSIVSAYYGAAVLPPGDFTVSATGFNNPLPAGSSAASTVTVASLNGLSGGMTLTVSAQAVPGLTASISPSALSLTSGGSVTSTLAIATTSLTPAGSYAVTISVINAGLIHSIMLSVTVSNTIPPLTCPPSSAITLPAQGSYTYTVGHCYRGEVSDSILYPDGIMINYGYDGLGRTWNVTRSGSSGYYAILSYNRNDRPTVVILGNGLTASYGYDKLSRPSLLTIVNSTRYTLLSLAYAYNATGTVNSITGSVNGQTVNEHYWYDQLLRLTNATITSNGANTALWYQYDTLGNRVWQSLNGTKTSYTYNNVNELTRACVAPSGNNCSTTSSYSYDANGNLNTTTIGTTSWTYTWNPSGQLTKGSNNAGTQGTYAYDADGRRVKSQESSVTTFYAYTGPSVLYQRPASGTATDFIFINGQLTCNLASGSTVSYYHDDVLGSTRLVTDRNGKPVFTDGYQPFGQDNGTPSGTETYKFTGKPVSQTTGLYYEYQRWYDASTGRFISQDPLPGVFSDPETLNPYVYVQNIPTTLTDPSGAAELGAGCFGQLCQGPDPSVNLCFAGGCNPELCAENPFICGGWDGSPDTADSGGVNCFCPMGDTGTGPGDSGGGSAIPGGSEPGATSVTVSDTTTPTITDTQQFTVRTIGQQIENLPPTGQEPNSILRQFNDQGLRKVGIYDSNGNLVERIDVTGPPHNDVPTPHVVENVNWRVEPRAPTGWQWDPVFRGPTTDWENRLIGWLSQLED